MSGRVYYNERDKYAAQWLRGLIAGGMLPEGHADERDIRDVKPEDLRDFTQCHFFAGIGGWAAALEIAGVDTRRAIWTGSCPCQPFSQGGLGKGVEDERHLWPEFFRLIAACKPPRVFGEQVASTAGVEWLDIVFDDLESEGYSTGAADLPAASVGLPHVRQRLFWYANADVHDDFGATYRARPIEETTGGRFLEAVKAWRFGLDQLVSMGVTERCYTYAEARELAHGLPGVVGKIRGFGNAIVPAVAAEFVSAALEASEQRGAL